LNKLLALVALFLANACVLQGQISNVGVTKASSNSSSTQWSVRVTPLAGDALLVGCDFNAGITFVGVSDTAGDTFTQIAPEADSPTFSARAYLATNVKGGSTTVSCSATSGPPNNEIYVTELKGVSASTPVDRVQSLAGTTGSAAGSLATTNANEFVWGYITSGTVTNANGWTSLSGYDGNLVTSMTQAAPGTLSASFPVTMSWTLILVALNPVATAATAQPISLSISPASTTVQVTQSSSFTATVQNDSLNKGVTWALSGAGCSGASCGTLSKPTTTSVTYTAPAGIPAPATVTLLATSLADSTKSARATISVAAAPSISVSISPATSAVQVGTTSSFLASLQNDALNKGVTWSLSGAGCSGVTCGTLTNASTTSVTYAAPSAVPAPATVTLLATSLADSTKSAGATITVAAAPPISVSVSPATATVQVNQTTPFTSTLQNDSLNRGVSWTLSGAGCSGSSCGTLTNVTTSSVTYKAPASVPNPSNITLTATSVADTTKTSTSTITVSAVVAQPTITTVGTTHASKNDGSKQWSVGITPLAGDTLIVGCDFNPGISFVGVSDAAGDTFTLLVPEADSPDFAARAYLAMNVKGGSTTVTCSASSAPTNTEIYVTELKGVNSNSPVDKVLSVTESAGTTAGSLTTINPNEFLWAYVVSGQVTNATGWTQLSNYDGNLVTSKTQATPAAVQLGFPVTMSSTLLAVALVPSGGGVQTPVISVSVAPTNATVQVLGTLSLAATIQNDTSSKGVSWSLAGAGCSGSACGTLSNITNSSVTYTAPSSVPTPAVVTITATSVSDVTKSASASVTITSAAPPISISVSPASASVQISQSAGFTATIQNDSQNKGVTWSLSGSGCSGAACGTLTNLTTTAATYNAPSVPPSPASVTLKASSIANTAKSTSAVIAITSPPPTTPSGLTAIPNGSSQIDLSWTASTDTLGVSAYLVERCQGAGCSSFTQIASTPSTSFNDTGLSPSTSYSYRVRASDPANNLSSYSNSSTASTSASSSGGAAVPTLIWSKSAANTIFIDTQSYTSNLPTTGTLPGNVLLATFQYSVNTGASAAVTDDKGDSLTLLKTNSNGNQTVSTYCVTPTPGAHVLTISFSGAQVQYVSMINASEWFNLTCSLDASSASSNSLASVSAGSLSTSHDGDLIYQAAEEDGSTFTEQWFQGSAPWSLLSASRGLSGGNIPQATQYQVQTSHGTINPTFSMSIADSWNSVAVALLSASSGTAPPSGIRIVHLQEESVPPGQSSTVPLQFPSSGNLIITASIDGPGFDVAGISDSNGNSHTQIGGVLNDGFVSGDVQTFYAANAVTSTSLTMTFSMTGSPTGGSTFFLYDVTGAASAPYDSAAGRPSATGNQQSTGNIVGPTISPTTTNGLVIMQIAVTTNSIVGVSPGNFSATVPSPLDQTNPTDENNGWGFQYNTSTGSRQFIWTTQGSGGVGGWCSTAVAFIHK